MGGLFLKRRSVSRGRCSCKIPPLDSSLRESIGCFHVGCTLDMDMIDLTGHFSRLKGGKDSSTRFVLNQSAIEPECNMYIYLSSPPFKYLNLQVCPSKIRLYL